MDAKERISGWWLLEAGTAAGVECIKNPS